MPTHRQLRALERSLDRTALELAFAYDGLLDTLLDDADARCDLDPSGALAASLAGKSAALRELVRQLPPGATARPAAVYAVVRAASCERVGVFWTRDAAEVWLRRQGRAAGGFKVQELTVEPTDDVLLAEHARKVELARELVAETERELGPISEQLQREVDELWLEADADIEPPNAADSDDDGDDGDGDGDGDETT